jgi:hypothetical protein
MFQDHSLFEQEEAEESRTTREPQIVGVFVLWGGFYSTVPRGNCVRKRTTLEFQAPAPQFSCFGCVLRPCNRVSLDTVPTVCPHRRGKAVELMELVELLHP